MHAWHEWISIALRGVYKPRLARTGNSASALKAAEKTLGMILPARYREFIGTWNGGELRVRLLPLSKVLKAAAAKRGDESDPHGELPEYLVPIAEDPQGLELYCLDKRPKAGGRIVEFDPEEPGAGPEWPDFEAFLLDRVLGVVDPGPDADYLIAVAVAHGVHLQKQHPWKKWKTWEQCKQAIPAVPKRKREPALSLAQFQPGLRFVEEGALGCSGSFGKKTMARLSSTKDQRPRWTLNTSRAGDPTDPGVTRELGPEELRIISSVLAQHPYTRFDKNWAEFKALLQKSIETTSW